MSRALHLAVLTCALAWLGDAEPVAAEPAPSTSASVDPFNMVSHFAVLGELGRRSEADMAQMPGTSSTAMLVGMQAVGDFGDSTFLGAKTLIEFGAFFGNVDGFAMRLHVGTPLGFWSNGTLALAIGPSINLEVPMDFDFAMGARAYYKLASSMQLRAGYDFTLKGTPYGLQNRVDASLSLGRFAIGARFERGSPGGSKPDVTSMSTLAGLDW